MPRPDKVNRDALHAYFWRKANRRHQLSISIRELADDLGVNERHMGRIMEEMVDDGRLKKVRNGKNNVGVFSISDPDTWEPPTEEGKAPRSRRKLVWS